MASRYDLGGEGVRVWEWKRRICDIRDNGTDGALGARRLPWRRSIKPFVGLCRALQEEYKWWIYYPSLGSKLILALSDIGVIHKDGRYLLPHRLHDVVPMITTPEAMFGIAVAVNPNDDRYKDWLVKNAILPILNKPIPIVEWAHDPEFGTGVRWKSSCPEHEWLLGWSTS